MRRKTYDVLFETKTEMNLLGRERSFAHSLLYFALSLGLFGGGVSNHVLIQQPLGVRFAVVLAVIVITGVALCMEAFLLHGICETVGATSGDPAALICLLGYTALPFLVLTPVALLCTKIGLEGMLLFPLVTLVGLCWMLYLLVRALEVVYIIDFTRAVSVVCFSLLLQYVVFLLPLQLVYYLVSRQLDVLFRF